VQPQNERAQKLPFYPNRTFAETYKSPAQWGQVGNIGLKYGAKNGIVRNFCEAAQIDSGSLRL